MIYPCKYCTKNNACKRQKEYRSFAKQFNVYFSRMKCQIFDDRLKAGQKVIVSNLYVGQVENVVTCPVTGSQYNAKRSEFISGDLTATVLKRSKHHPTKVLIELDEELDEDTVGENCIDRKTFGVKESNLRLIEEIEN